MRHISAEMGTIWPRVKCVSNAAAMIQPSRKGGMGKNFFVELQICDNIRT